MHSELFQLDLPNFIKVILNIETLTIYSYPLCIIIGSLIAYFFLRKQEKEHQYKFFSKQLLILMISAALIGGKLFLFFERPLYFINNPNQFIDFISKGYVFYGSFITCIIVLIIHLKINKKPILKSLDSIALSILVLHAFGRIGCFLAGCCYGKPFSLGVIFPQSYPTPVHPTQLYEASFLLLLFIALNFYNKLKKFEGETFLLYALIYGFGRLIIEFFRGDDRGYIFNNTFSHSQVIAFAFIFFTISFYIKLKLQHIKNQQYT